MPNPTITEAIKEAYASCPTNRIIYDTLEIRQTGVQAPLFLVRGPLSITATDENGEPHVFKPSGFQMSLPPQNEEGFRSLNIAIDNINREASSFVERALESNTPIEVIYRPFLSDDLSAPQMDPPVILYLQDVQINAIQVTGRATFIDIMNKRYPSELYTRLRFPSLQ